MFVIFATKPLNDRTKGRRFNVFGFKGLVRIRKRKSVPFKREVKDCMTAYHFKRVSLYLEHGWSIKKLYHFAG
jgi:hypothetical protein